MGSREEAWKEWAPASVLVPMSRDAVWREGTITRWATQGRRENVWSWTKRRGAPGRPYEAVVVAGAAA